MILKEGYILYDIRSHETFVVDIVGTEQAHLAQVKFGVLEDTRCVMERGGGLKKKTITNDLDKITPVCDHGNRKSFECPYIFIGMTKDKIGTMCNRWLFDYHMLDYVKGLRKSKGYVPEALRTTTALTFDTAKKSPAKKSPAKKAPAKKTAAKKSKPTRKKVANGKNKR